MLRELLMVASASALLSACAGRSDYQTFYHAEQGDYDAALTAAKAAKDRGINGLIFGPGASECRDYNAVVTVYAAKGDFAGASNACRDYDEQCANVLNADLCFSYSLSELSAAGSDHGAAAQLQAEARQALHFRWLMLRDDYEGRPLNRPIY